eukprot:766991-Hanusia_phi.AAC.1
MKYRTTSFGALTDPAEAARGPGDALASLPSLALEASFDVDLVAEVPFPPRPFTCRDRTHAILSCLASGHFPCHCMLSASSFFLSLSPLPSSCLLVTTSHPHRAGTAFAYHASMFSNINQISPFASRLPKFGMMGRKRQFSKLILKGSISSMFQSKGRTPEALKETAELLARKKFDLDVDAILAIEAERKVVQSKA